MTHEAQEAWRRSQRERLIRERLGMAGELRAAHTTRIIEWLAPLVGDPEDRTVAGYWPVRGEPDLRPFLAKLADRGGRIALPVAIGTGRPLAFRVWNPGDPLEPGPWGVPTPPADARAVSPDLLLVPLVGFDRSCHRLGYGGGYYDRTLASLPDDVEAVGIGFASALIASIHPQPHDRPMDLVVTERGAMRPVRGGDPSLEEDLFLGGDP